MKSTDNRKKPRLCLLIAAHNEELVIQDTIKSAITAGMNPKYIYVVNDNSKDNTAKMARQLLPPKNVISVRRSGKGLALTKAIRKFQLAELYRWIHIADADGYFASNYFKQLRKNLRIKNIAATGYIQSMPGGYISQNRVFEYTVGMDLHRRIQSHLNVIPVIPGPTSCFRADIIGKLNFANKSFTEDFDVTLQIHRQKLGKIQFIPSAITFTQDPGTFVAFYKQITRWNRGVMQGMVNHKIGSKASPIDAYLGYQLGQSMFFLMYSFIWLPIIAYYTYGANVIAVAFLFDVLLTVFITILVVTRTKRTDILAAFPFIYILRFVNLFVFIKAFTEVIILRKFINQKATLWTNTRYKLAS